MLKKLVDTNIFIDRFMAPERFRGLFLSEGLVCQKSSSITNDCLIASSARNAGAMVYTQNKRDFEAIHTVFDFQIICL